MYKVLIVDDSPTSRAIVRTLVTKRLSHQEVEFIEASGGKSALEAAERHRPHLMVIDVRMDDMSGVELCRQVRRHSQLQLQRMPLLLLTSVQDPATRAAALSAGASEYFLKPVDNAALADAIVRYLAGQQGGPALNPAQQTALVVDDSATTRALVMVHLASHRFNFVEAQDGHQGLALARQHRPALIIADLRMPGVDGFTFCRSIRADKLLSGTPVILLTGARDGDIKTEAASAGISHYLAKPIDSAKLNEVVTLLLKKG